MKKKNTPNPKNTTDYSRFFHPNIIYKTWIDTGKPTRSYLKIRRIIEETIREKG